LDQTNDNKIEYFEFIKYHHSFPAENIKLLFENWKVTQYDLDSSQVTFNTSGMDTPL